jgi:hypothetical protein
VFGANGENENRNRLGGLLDRNEGFVMAVLHNKLSAASRTWDLFLRGALGLAPQALC